MGQRTDDLLAWAMAVLPDLRARLAATDAAIARSRRKLDDDDLVPDPFPRRR